MLKFAVCCYYGVVLLVIKYIFLDYKRDINDNHYKVEKCFRILKTKFVAQPVFHRNKTRIITNFMICYTKLLIYRLLENIDKYGSDITTDNILGTLQNMNVVNTKDSVYAATFTVSEVCISLNGLFDFGIEKNATGLKSKKESKKYYILLSIQHFIKNHEGRNRCHKKVMNCDENWHTSL